MTAVSIDQDVTDRVLGDLDEVGYSVVESLLSPERAAAIRAGLREILDATPTGRNDFEGFQTRRIYAIFAKTRVFDDLAVHPLLLSVLDAVLGPSYQLSAPTGIEIAPGEKASSCTPTTRSTRCRRPHGEVVLNTMWAFDDFTADNGATRVVPGSHRWTDRVPVDPDETVTVTMPAGSVLFIRGRSGTVAAPTAPSAPASGSCWSTPRVGCASRRTTSSRSRRQIVRMLEPRLQELIGYGIHPPFVGYVDGHHPRRVLGET